MALLPQDRRGQMLLFLTVFSVTALYFTWAGTPIGGIPGISQLGLRRDSLLLSIDSLEGQIQEARRTIASGGLPELERRNQEYTAQLELMRQLVPVGTEIPNLMDDITSRARMRGAEPVNIVPSYPAESGSPFDTQRARFTVTGEYDQIGEFLSDVASLPRIIVPYDVRIERVAANPGADTSRFQPNTLQLNFQIRTYVKTPAQDSSASGRGSQ